MIVGRTSRSCPSQRSTGHHLVDNEFRQGFDVGAQTWVFTDPKVDSVLGIQQVVNLLVVDLGIGCFYCEVNVGVVVLLRLDSRKQLGTCKWYNALLWSVWVAWSLE